MSTVSNKICKRWGRASLALEKALYSLQSRCREAGMAGRTSEADAAWCLYEQTRKQLANVKVRIRVVEAQLYSRRRHTSR